MGALLWIAAPSVVNNAWSLQVERKGLTSGLATADLTSAPKNHPRVLLWRGLSALAQGHPNDAVAVLEEAAQQSPDAILHSSLGEAYESTGDMSRAVKEWAAADAWRPMRMAGLKAIRERRFNDASIALGAAFDLQPDQSASDWASLLFSRDEPQRAEAVLRTVINQFPGSASNIKWRIELGDMLGKQGRWPDAMTLFRDAVAYDDSSPDAHIGLGRAMYFTAQGLEQALTELRVGIELDPHRAKGYAAMGEVLRAERDYDRADFWYSRAMQEEPENIPVISRRIDSLSEAGNLPSALTIANEAVNRFPYAPHLYYELGAIHRGLRQVELAVQYAEKSVVLDGGRNPLYLLSLASLYEQSGRTNKAVSTYRAVLSVNPGNLQAGHALARLGAQP